MSQLPSERQEQILAWLRKHHTLTIEAISTRLNVSAMTVHRDLNELERGGLVEKMHGGVALAGYGTRDLGLTARSCHLCEMPVSARTTMLIQIEREPLYACCPHCGFLMLDDTAQALSVLVRDFIYGRMVNALQAVFLLQSDISLCCMPCTLAFSSLQDAERFQRGFNGWIANFEQARQFLTQEHNTNPD
jgi:DNA-binding Lrp family transcriptional regulator